jgi:hypothetical protein
MSYVWIGVSISTCPLGLKFSTTVVEVEAEVKTASLPGCSRVEVIALL